MVAINAINGTKAGLGGSYLAQILQDYNQNIKRNSPTIGRISKNAGLELNATFGSIDFTTSRLALVPGILAFLVTLVGGMLSAKHCL